MIEAAALAELCGYAGTIWCVANLAWGVFRNDALRALIYGIGCFAALIVALNVGGILNETTWGIFGCMVFGIHLIAAIIHRTAWKVVLHGFMLGISVLSVTGLI